MSNDAGCPVILWGYSSWSTAQEQMLCSVYDSWSGHLSLNDVPVNSQCNHFCNTKEKKTKHIHLNQTEKIVPDGNCFIYVEETKCCRILSLVSQNVPGTLIYASI